MHLGDHNWLNCTENKNTNALIITNESLRITSLKNIITKINTFVHCKVKIINYLTEVIQIHIFYNDLLKYNFIE